MATRTLVIGANRGIGFELAKQLTKKGREVIATYRQDAGDLSSLDVQTIGGVDIADAAGVEKLEDGLGGKRLNEVLIVSGILRSSTLEDPNWDDIEAQFIVNAVGPLRAAACLHHRIDPGGKLAILTSRMASMSDNGSGGAYGYRMSKAAVNAAGVSLAQDLKGRNIAVSLFHPGFVKTDMTGGNGHITPDESARLLIERLEEMSMETTGTFWHANGERLPW